MIEYGSEFYYPLSNMTNIDYDNNLIENVCDIRYLRSGREAALFIANQINLTHDLDSIILIPDLCCESMIKPYEVAGYKIVRYNIDNKFSIVFNDFFIQNLLKANAILLMNYYGLSEINNLMAKVKKINSSIFIIVDVTHVAFSVSVEEYSLADYLTLSYRKLFAIEEGGVAISCKKKFTVDLEHSDGNVYKLRNEGLLLKNEYIATGFKNQLCKKTFRNLFAKAEELLKSEYKIVPAQDDSVNKILNLSCKKLLEIRLLNYQKLYEDLNSINSDKISLLPYSDSSYFMLPIIVNNGMRDSLQVIMAKQGLYSQVLWPMYYDEIKDMGNFAKDFSKNMLALPIDQRYTLEDIDNMTKIIKTSLAELNKNRILIVGASFLQVPAIIKAKELGLYVAVADYDDKAVGIPYADEYYNASTIDYDALCNVVEKFRPNGIMTMATDMPMRAISKVCQKFNLPSISEHTAILATDKLMMIKKFEEMHVSHPWYYSASNENELKKIALSCEYPCIMKPIDSSGSRGVVLCNDAEELMKEYSYTLSSSMSRKVIIEEYLVGNEVSVEVFVDKGDVHVLQITDKMTSGAPHFVEVGHNQPTKLNAIAEIEELATKAVLAIGIENGPAHVEIMVTNKGAKMIELGARMGGDCITSDLVPLSTGIDMTKNTIMYAIGGKIDLSPKHKRFSMIRFIKADKIGKLLDIENIEKVKKMQGVVKVELTHAIGDNVGLVHSSSDRLGHIIVVADSYEIALSNINSAINLINVIIEPIL